RLESGRGPRGPPRVRPSPPPPTATPSRARRPRPRPGAAAASRARTDRAGHVTTEEVSPVAVLLLNASLEPLRAISLRRALCVVLEGKAESISTRDGEMVRSAGGDEFPVPLVVRLNYMVKVPYNSRVPLNRRTLTWRDRGECQVKGCDRRGNTVDHVI